jgi:hypothetical protein
MRHENQTTAPRCGAKTEERMKTEIIAWVLLSILGIVTVWLGYRAVEMHERVRKSIEELKKEIEYHENRNRTDCRKAK